MEVAVIGEAIVALFSYASEHADEMLFPPPPFPLQNTILIKWCKWQCDGNVNGISENISSDKCTVYTQLLVHK